MDDFSRYLGIDHGEKRIGVAVSDPLRITARPLVILENSDNQTVVSLVRSLISEQDVSKIVIGLPTDAQSELGYQAKIVIDWCKMLAETITTPIVLWDETNSSQSVKSSKKSKYIDDQAAAAILQDYLIANQGAAHEPGQPLSQFQ